MAVITKWLVWLVLIMLAGAMVAIQHNALKNEREKTILLRQATIERDETIHQLQQMDANNKKLLSRLQTESQRITTTLSEREALIEKLHHGNQQVHDWAAAPLPDAVIRLRHRQAANSAHDYHPGLPEPDKVLPAVSQPGNER